VCRVWRRRPAPRLSRQRRESLQLYLFLAPAVAYLGVFFVYPIVQNVLMSFQNVNEGTFITGSAPWVGAANYSAVLHSQYFRSALTNTLLFTAGSIAGQFVIGLLLALFFNRVFPLNNVLRTLLLLPWLLPLITTAAVWKWVLDQDSGVVNQTLHTLHLSGGHIPWLTSTSLALASVIIVNIWAGIPFNMTILYGGLKEIPKDYYEAASIDGAHGWQSFRHITWPLLRPVVGVVLVLGIVYTVKVFDLTLGLTQGGPANSTQTLATQSYQLSFINFNFGAGAAISDILMVISMIFAILYLRTTRKPWDA